MSKHGQRHDIEVKAKGEVSAKLNYVHRAFVGQQLLDASGYLRSCHLNYYTMEGAMENAHAVQLHWLATVIANALQSIALQPPTRFGERSISVADGTAVLRSTLDAWTLTLKHKTGWHVALHAMYAPTSVWFHSTLRSHTAHVPERVAAEKRAKLAAMLSRFDNERQLKNTRAIYVVVWPAPLESDGALRGHPRDVMEILDSITDQVDMRRGAPTPIALWVASFEYNELLLNSCARGLLGVDRLATRG